MTIAASVGASRRVHQWLAGALLTLAVSVASAGPGFIESSRVLDSSSGDESATTIEVRFNCKAEYLRHEPRSGGDQLRIYLDPTTICNGVSPVVAESRSRSRPFNSDSANLVDLQYDGNLFSGPVLTLNFDEPVSFAVDMSGVSFELTVHVRTSVDVAATEPVAPAVQHRQVARPIKVEPELVINLASFQRIPTIADAPGLQLAEGKRLFYTEVIVDSKTWYRLRMGTFKTADEVTGLLPEVRLKFPGAWVDKAGEDTGIELASAARESTPTSVDQSVSDDTVLSKVDALMEDARKAMAADEISRAVQIYTKILQQSDKSRHPEAQEYLALAREKKGQFAHAKAEYQRYLSLYPEHESAARVSQRLAALMASDRRARQPAVTAGSVPEARPPRQSDWRFRTYMSQYYRRDVNQPNDADEIVSQSALYSDVNLDIRRRGERFDFSSRLSAGYRNDFVDDGSGNQLRVSYAYADLADARTGLRGRVGRQSRNTGGVLGRFDGLYVGYDVNDRILVNAVAGKPAYSASDSIDSARTFYGTSINYGPIFENLELGLYFIQQDIEGTADRQAVGGEFRYFGANKSFWGLIDYDTLFNELGSAFLQGSWRFASKLSLHGSLDRRHSPFLRAGNALIGQPVLSFSELLEIYPEQEIRQFSLDRSPLSTTYTLGASYSLTPRIQMNANVSESTIDETPPSGGVAATPSTSYRYYHANFVASSLLKEGDVSIFGLRYSNSDTSSVTSMTIDTRYPFGRTWRVNPRLRIDRRQRVTDSSDEWIYTPGIRIQYRRSQKMRIQLEAGKQFARDNSTDIDRDRESYYVNLGYQLFF